MLNWEFIIENYTCKYFNKIKKTTQPLQDHFGVEYFTYHRIDNDGKYTVLVDRPDWAEYYVREKLFLTDPFLRNPTVYQSGVFSLEFCGTEEYRENIFKDAKNVLNMDLGLILIQRKENGVEFFGFGGNKRTCSIEKIYLNKPQILTSFAAYFKNEFHSTLLNMQDEAHFLFSLKGNDYHCEQPLCPTIAPTDLLSYFNDIGMKKEIEKVSKLSRRELQCLQWLIQDKSYKEIAAILGLSPRTIETHLENIKNKLNCWNKHEVLEVAKRLHSLGLVDTNCF